MEYASAIILGPEICKALKIETTGITAIDIKISVNDPVYVNITRMLLEEESNKITESIKGYYLMEDEKS